MKTCSKCKKRKPISKFYKDKTAKNGYRNWCKECRKKYEEIHYQNNKEKILKQHKKYQENHKKEILQYAKQYRETHKTEIKKWRQTHKKQIKIKFMLKTYGISLTEYNEILKKQKRLCAICGKKFKNSGDCHIDHNHKTGKVGGLLCGKCNRGIGMFEENISILENAIKYLKKERKKNDKQI